MITEFRGKVKENDWFRATCRDDGESRRSRRKARSDFRHDCRAEGIRVDVASPDVIGEALEGSELYPTDPD